MKSRLAILSLLALTAQTICAQEATPTPSPARPEGSPIPLLNGDFSSPKVPEGEKYINVSPEKWTFDAKAGVPSIGFAAWRPTHPQFFFWPKPDGSMSQIVDPKVFSISKAGDVLKLSYQYGGNGSGAYQLIATLLVDGKAAATATHDIQGPKLPDELSNVLSYTTKAEDGGKSVGVSLTLKQQGDASLNILASVNDVALILAPPEAAK